MSENFVHLHVHSAYSLAEGAIKVKDLVKMCGHAKMPAVAITDTNNLFGAMEFALEASKAGVQPILGCQITIDDEGHQLVLLVQNEIGYRNLCKIVSDAYMHDDSQGDIQSSISEISQFSDGLICLSGGSKGHISDAVFHGQIEKAEENLQALKKIFNNRFYIEIQRHNLPEEDQVEHKMIDLAYQYDVPLVATNDCYFKDRGAHEAHDALLCIADGRYVTEQDRRRVTVDHYFKSTNEMIDLFKDLPEAIQNTSIIAQRCSYLLKPIAPILPPFETESKRPEFEELIAQSKEGFEWRLDKFVYKEGLKDEEKKEIAKPYFERLDFELDVINKMGFPGYFLIVSDFIKWSKDNNIPVGPGRGSGAGSIVAWALKITDLDPLEFGLLFERFLNPERVSMPDFDIDFCQDRRDEVIRYVQERYGYDHVAQIITFGKLQARAVVRDVGRVLQMPYGQVDRIAKMIPNNPAAPMTLQEALNADADLRAERKKDETQGKLIDIALQLEGLYRHASTHAAGVVIGDRPLDELVPLYRDPRSDMPVTQFNMKYVEQAGLVKFDFLGLKTMTVVQKSLDFVEEETGQKINILDIPLDDEKAYELMARGNTVGVFQLESAGMRDTLKKVKPNRFEDIIALVSLYRPGPMDNIPKYIDVKEEREEPDYMHDILQPFLEETYGIMIYQEDVIKVAHAIAGMSLGEAEGLRKCMSKKRDWERMETYKERFLAGAKKYGISQTIRNEIWRQIDSFAGYSFCKAHSASFALVSYRAAYLKAHYPAEFMAAVLTNEGGFYDVCAYFEEARRLGIVILAPHINWSRYEFFAEQPDVIRIGFMQVRGLSRSTIDRIIRIRKERMFESIHDFLERVVPDLSEAETLVHCGALDNLGLSRPSMFVETLIWHRKMPTLKNRAQARLPLEINHTCRIPEIPELTERDKLLAEIDALELTATAHPMALYGITNKHWPNGFTRAKDLGKTNRKLVSMLGIIVTYKSTRTSKGELMKFVSFEDPTGIFEVTLFPGIYQRFGHILADKGPFAVKGKVEEDSGSRTVTALWLGPLLSEARR